MGDDAAAAAAIAIEEEITSRSTKTKTKTKTKTSTSIFLQIVEHPDGSITRPDVPNIPPTPTPTPTPSSHDDTNSPTTVLSKDLPLDPNLNTSIRLYLPNNNNNTSDGSQNINNNNKLPIIVYYHGGGFVLFSPQFVLYHQFCQHMASAIPALILSLDYRLAPEHKLPAAYDDAISALMWLRTPSTDPWILNHGDLSRCFLMGSSSGGNMAYFAALRAATLDHLHPIKLRGVLLIQPYFGGEERTQSEIDSKEDDILPLRANEMMWRMALPQGADRDHPYCNPMANSNNNNNKLPLPLLLPFRTMVMGCRGDPLFDRQQVFVKMLAAAGVDLVDRLQDKEKGYHAIELFDTAKAQAMFAHIKEFVHASSSL